MFEELQKVFFNFDPAEIDVESNNLLDEYDSEIHSLLCIHDEDGSLKTICDLAMALDEILTDSFYPLEITLKEEFVNAVAQVLSIS